MAWTLAQLRTELAKTLDSFVTGTVTGGSTTTIIDTELLDSGQYADDHFNGADLYIYDTTDDAAPEGECRYCTDFVQDTGTLTVGKEFTAAPGAGDTYEIYLRCKKEELDQALMFAVKDWRFVSSDDLVDTTAEYTVTANHLHRADQIVGVWAREANEASTNYVQIINVRIWDNAGAITLEFEDTEDLDPTMYVRIEYLAQFSQLKSSGAFLDTATVGGDLARHILHAQLYFYEKRLQSASGIDREQYGSLVRYTSEKIDKLEDNMRRPSSKAKVQSYDRGVPRHRYQGQDWWL